MYGHPLAAVLFARRDSVYKSLPGLDVYDIDRDARTYAGSLPVIAHPPCRAWGSLRHFAKPRPDEKELAIFAVDCVRRFGGVLEHPLRSSLFSVAGLPPPGQFDDFGGFTLPVDQDWWGHRAEKATKLYIVGVHPADLPPIPLRLEDAPCLCISRAGHRKGMPRWRPELKPAEREATPPDFARWLIDTAARCRRIKEAA